MEDFISLYHGTPDGLELLLKQWCWHWGTDDDRSMEAHALVAAVNEYGRGVLDWDYFIRKLLRKGADIHGKVSESHRWFRCDQICHKPQHATVALLFELFDHTETPFQADKAGDAWLDLLASEGYNIKEYLDRLRSEYEAQKQVMPYHRHRHASVYENESLPIARVLTFQVEGIPHVSWAWQVDPSSPLFLLHREFEHLLMSPLEYWHLQTRTWPQTWPFECPRRAFMCSAATKRAHRRMEKKAMKARRALRSRSSVKIPGAWPL